MNKEELFQRITDVDQAMAAYETMGKAAATYYQSMVDGGMPESLAADLLLDWHRLFVWRQLWPNTPPRWEMDD